MGKHNKARRRDRRGQIMVAAAAASVLAGWGAPAAYADDGAESDSAPKPVSKTVGAVRDTVDTVCKTLSEVGDSVQRTAERSLQGGAGGNGTALTPKGPKTSLSSSGGFIQSERKAAAETPEPGNRQLNVADLDAPALRVPDVVSNAVNLPDLGLPGLQDLPGVPDLGAGGVGIPPSFGSQGDNRFLLPPSGLTNGNNLFGLNFYNIGDDNLFTANNLGTGLQAVFAGDDNTLAGNQVILPSSFGTNFVSMGDNNGNLGLANFDLDDLLNLDLPSLLAVQPSGTNFVGSLFSYGNNTAIMGDDNQGTGNNVLLGAFNFGNNMHIVGDDSDGAGNNIVAGIGNFGNNMSFIGDDSSGSGNNSLIGTGGFANNLGLIGDRSDGSGNNSNTSLFGGFAQNFVLIGSGADGSGNNTNTALFGGFAQNVALIGNGADGSGNNTGAFNFALVGSGVDDAGNNDGLFNVAIFPGEGGGNCTGPACFTIFGAQFGE